MQIDWIVNFIGPDGFRESFKITGEDPVALVDRREKVLKQIIDLGGSTDVRNPFKESGAKVPAGGGKLARRAAEGVRSAAPIPEMQKPADATDVSPMEQAAIDSDPKPTEVKIAPIKAEEYGFRQRAAQRELVSKVVAPSAPNTNTGRKLKSFVQKEKGE